MFARNLLSSAVTLIVASSLSPTAQAQTAPTDLYGGGASSIAPFWRQSADCYGVKTDLLIRKGDNVAPETLTIPYFNNGTDNCATLPKVDPNLTVHYTSTGSGTGIKGYVANDPSKYGWTDWTGTEYADVDYAISEAPIKPSDVDPYYDYGPNDPFPSTTMGGPVIQVPLLIAPVAIAYDPVYRDVNGVEHSLNIATVDGKLHLSRENYCKIFTGEITDWSNAAFQADNNGQPLASSPVAIEVVAHSDSSGTSNLFTRHMAKVCGDTSTGGVFPLDGTKKYPQMIADYNVDHPNDQITNTIYADQNFGVATAINYSFNVSWLDDTPVNTARIGYLGANHVEQWATRTGANSYALDAAVLENHDGGYVALSPAAAQTAFSNGYTLPSGAESLFNPDAWVGIDTQAHKDALYDPRGAESYPIIGTSNMLAYTCYDNDHGEYDKVRNYFAWYYNSANLPTVGTGGSDGLLTYAGLAPIPSALQELIINTFLFGNNGLLSLQRIRNANGNFVDRLICSSLSASGA